MTGSLSHDEARLLRLRAQRLDWRWPADGVSQAAADTCGLQAQDASAASLAVRVRTRGLTAAQVERARVDERSVVRTWCMRGTLHLLAAPDLAWLLPLFAPRVGTATQARFRELGLDEDTCVRAVAILGDMLAGGPLTRAEIVQRLALAGICVDGQAAHHVVRRAALEGVLCLGPDRGAKDTYVLLDGWLDSGNALEREGAWAMLARRHLAAYGPAGPADLAAWSGLLLGQARSAFERIAGELEKVSIEGSPSWMLAGRAAWLEQAPAPDPIVRLLPAFDTYLLGHHRRDLILDPRYTLRFNRGGGMLSPTLIVDGRVVATWRALRHRNGREIVVEPFEDLPPLILPGLEAEVADIGRFLETGAALSVLKSS